MFKNIIGAIGKKVVESATKSAAGAGAGAGAPEGGVGLAAAKEVKARVVSSGTSGSSGSSSERAAVASSSSSTASSSSDAAGSAQSAWSLAQSLLGTLGGRAGAGAGGGAGIPGMDTSKLLMGLFRLSSETRAELTRHVSDPTVMKLMQEIQPMAKDPAKLVQYISSQPPHVVEKLTKLSTFVAGNKELRDLFESTIRK
ncbi:hypothetical protein CAOG_02504 [Capsaspora owczarzaki ATCC 30864]|uniref:Uncharacterized protein n=1 Tax=Capsaspora owczarzaki (strain ATCC 30864) TaxID=595528 RepID=A0A0D2WLC6_CAPO3|nr:hypothetical protein CAOG_02504 [Capsaspora owczarzaki ATCC 30864]KJE91360.1 hypothetical protein CAOG_002504 [Capsaspora owczarzaki ATCC 30864]|eukprot:XP_004349254.1 hypothetical protein CAOG_02504 [Capsaspora owczarzaki ATCC 30864]